MQTDSYPRFKVIVKGMKNEDLLSVWKYLKPGD